MFTKLMKARQSIRYVITLLKLLWLKVKIERNKLFMKVYKQLQKELVPVRPNRKRKRKHPGVKFPQNQKS